MKFLYSLLLFILAATSLLAQTPPTSTTPTQTVVLSEDGDSPAILFDEREISQAELAAMDSQNIGDIQILSGEEAQARFGKYSTHGAIVISTKAQAPVVTETVTTVAPSEKVSDAMSDEVKMSFGTDLNAYVIIDGKPSTMKVLEGIETDKIKSMMVLKAAVATEKYGDVAKEGAIEVTTKQ
ncbi:MAG: hypothetical protein AB8F78_12330 [Saprospiraceae bacterium]